MDLTLFNIVRGVIGVFVVVTLIKNYIFLVLTPFWPIRERLRYIRHAKARKKEGLATYRPKVSVIVPAWNEEVGIVKTLESIVHNGYANIELIVINDGSTDSSDAIIKGFFAQMRADPHNTAKICYIYKDNGGKGQALNTGIQQATGDIIMTVDADSALKAGAITNLVKYYMDEDIMAVVGNVEVINASHLIGFAQQLEYYFGFYNKRAHAILGAEYIFGGACASFRASVFTTIGLFDTENKTEDIEMSMRTKYFGLKSTYAEDVICYTEGASDLKGLISQRIRWKKGRLDTFLKYRSLFFSTEDTHNFFLSFFVLPFSVLTELQLIFEPIAIAILIAYSLITSEYLSLAIGIMFIFLVFVAVSVFHDNKKRLSYILYFPFIWPLFYVLDWVEFISLYKSLKLMRQGKDVEWQRWDRKGIQTFLEKGQEVA